MKIVKLLEELRKQIVKDFGKPCRDYADGCAGEI